MKTYEIVEETVEDFHEIDRFGFAAFIVNYKEGHDLDVLFVENQVSTARIALVFLSVHPIEGNAEAFSPSPSLCERLFLHIGVVLVDEELWLVQRDMLAV